MLNKSVELNLSIAAPYGKKIKTVMYATVVLLILTVGFGWEQIGWKSTMVVFAVSVGALLMLLTSLLKCLFQQSLFGEDAYTYMLFPISDKAVVWGKLVAAMYWVLWSVAFAFPLMTFLYFWWRDFTRGDDVTYWDLDVVETLTEDLQWLGHMLFRESFSASAVVFMIGAAVLQVVLVCAMVCSEIQLCVILNHIYNPNEKKKYIRILLTLGVVVDVLLCLYLPTKIFCLLSDGFITILPLAVTMVLELLLTVVYGKCSVMLLEKEYELN